MAKKEIILDDTSQEGFNDIELAFPVVNERGIATHYRKASVSKELYDIQMSLDDEDRNPEFREGAFKKASALQKKDFLPPATEGINHGEIDPQTAERERRIAQLEARLEQQQKQFEQLMAQQNKGVPTPSEIADSGEAHELEALKNEADLKGSTDVAQLAAEKKPKK